MEEMTDRILLLQAATDLRHKRLIAALADLPHGEPIPYESSHPLFSDD